MKKLYEKFIRRISRMFWNHTVHSIILEAMKKNIINSHQSHAILGAWNANCFPERGYRSFLHEGGRTPRALDGATVWREAAEQMRGADSEGTPCKKHGIPDCIPCDMAGE